MKKKHSEKLILTIDDITDGLQKNKVNPNKKRFSFKKQIWTKVEEPLDIKVIIPYVKVTPLLQTVVDSLRIQFIQPELHKLKDKEDYFNLLSNQWKKKEEFFIVEHDIIVWPGSIASMHECKELWCVLPSLCHGKMIKTSFGCAKFSKELMEKEPDIWDEAGNQPNGKIWWSQDSNFASAMKERDYSLCNHYPAAIHLNETQWPDSISKRASYKKVVWQYMEQNKKDIEIILEAPE